ncbi:CHAT domain-containing protein [Sorangium sp. So ce341]|uniref:CHAT domain-containing protein n=1 Tax=Sorangium sp. So ce341 TaxID=3133302 RepID=UPI003F648CFC
MRAAALTLALLGLGCGEAEETAAPAPPPLTVELAGCAAVRAGPVCELPRDRVVRLWIQAPRDAAVTVTAGGPAVPARGAEVQGGVLARVRVEDGARSVIVTAARAGAQATFRLDVDAPEAIPALERAEALRQAGRFDEAEAELEPLGRDPRPSVRSQARRKLARLARARGQTARAVELLVDAIREDREDGRISDEFKDRFTLAYIRVQVEHRLEEARRELDALLPLAPAYPEGGAIAPYFRGLAAAEAGDMRATLRLFREAAERTARLGIDDYRRDAVERVAQTLGALGRNAEAVALFREIEAELPADADPCRRALLLNNAGWFALRAAGAGAGDGALPDPAPLFDEALSLAQRPCVEPIDRPHVLINLALALVERGRVAEAERRLAEARRAGSSLSPRVEAWRLLLEGRIALAGGRAAQALPWFDRLSRLARDAAFPEAQFEGALGRAEAEDALGRAAAAGASYARAEELLAAWSRSVPLGEGRDTFLGRYERCARLHVDFLLREARRSPGAAAKAAQVARRSRARLLSSLDWADRVGALAPDARARWEAALAAYRDARAALDARTAADWGLPKERHAAAAQARAVEHVRLRGALDDALARLELGSRAEPPSPADGELVLAYHPVREGWAAFAVTGEGARAVALGPVDPRAAPARLGAQLLGPFAEEIGRARRLRFAAYGPLDRLDLHALPHAGQPLLARVPAAYGLDLPPRPAAPASPRSAVVVGDPRGDLPAARAEAAARAADLARRGWAVEHLAGQAATHDAVRAAVERPGVSLLHYAGHGVFEGRDGFRSGLPLAGGGWLTVGDVLALERVPPVVVLSGCDTARTAELARAEGLGLAQAFAAAGASAVVAAARPVRDALAAELMAALYGGPAGAASGPPPERAGPRLFVDDVPAALGAVELHLLRAHPEGDWTSFRAIVR